MPEIEVPAVNGNTLRLVRFLFLFFIRRLLVHRAMQSRISKAMLLATVSVSYVGFCVLTFIVVRGMVLDASAVLLVSQSISLTVGLWTMLFFIVIRVLFMKAGRLIELTHTFPVTNKQRILAYTLFEGITVLFCVASMTAPLTASVVIRGGSGALPEIVFGIIAQVIVLYLLLDVVYLSSDRVLHLLHIERWRSVLLPCLFGAMLFGTYGYVKNESVEFLDAFYEQRAYYGYSRLYVLLYERIGLPLAGSVVLATMLAITALIILIAPNHYSQWKYFFNIPIPNVSGLFGSCLRAVIRNGEFLLATFFVVSLSVVVLWIPGHYPPYWLAVISLQAVYAITTIEPIRKTYRYRLSPVRYYLYLSAPYLVVEMLISLPVLGLSIVKGLTLLEALKTLFICVVVLIAALAVSIFFPAEKHNPFSVLLGIATALALVILIAFTTLIWEIPDEFTTVVWFLVAAVCIYYSIIGIASTQRRNYYADI
ncbi:hypothetical protein [Arcanobacterium phocae]|uniref:hypothetical protein n=1 Tax=Arcanobacterium phocae TaxID=131112 RepID=UPI001C0F41CD|nr:hypothetical protein [Arcanobacterium phocae]